MHLAVVDCDMGGEGLGPAAVEWIERDGVDAAARRLDGERGGSGGDIEHRATAQGGQIEGKKTRVFGQRAAEEGDGGKFEWRGGRKGRGHGGCERLRGKNKKPDSG